MSKTFPHINFKDMQEIYTKCKNIREGLYNMIPEDMELMDCLKVCEGHSWFDKGTVDVKYKSFVLEYLGNCTYRKRGYNLIYNFTSVTENKVTYSTGYCDEYISYTSDLTAFIEDNTGCVKETYRCSLTHPHLASGNYHQKVLHTVEKVLSAFESNNDVNTFNLELAAALQFLEELGDEWKDGLKTYDKGELEELKILKAEESCKNLKDAMDKKYEEDVEKFKQSLEAIKTTTVTPKEAPSMAYQSGENDKSWMVGLGIMLAIVVASVIILL